jgi:hypothetical protein
MKKKQQILLTLTGFIMISLSAHSQMETIIHSLNKKSNVAVKVIKGDFLRKKMSQNGREIEYLKFSNLLYNIAYTPAQSNIKCGYFTMNKQKFEFNNSSLPNLFCDLDDKSFELYQIKLRREKYLLLTCIGNVSGTGTRRVFCNLFNITSTKSIKFYPLYALYGSFLNFNDFNSDGILDFLQTRYDKYDPNYIMTFTSLKGNSFVVDTTKYIKIQKVIDTNNINFHFKILKRKW